MTRSNDAGGGAAKADGALRVMDTRPEPGLLNIPEVTSAVASY